MLRNNFTLNISDYYLVMIVVANAKDFICLVSERNAQITYQKLIINTQGEYVNTR